MSLRDKLRQLPEGPGVYLFKDQKGKILYIGKALSLKKRVKSYFQGGESSPRIGILVSKISDVEWIVTESEAEAFLLESNLIKHHHPRYNIRFRDDKSYPYIKLSLNEKFPRVFLTRNPKKDGASYFGPYTNVKAARKTLRLIHRLFPLRRCKDKFRTRLSPCLNFHIKECSAPCVGRINKQDYHQLVKDVSLFLEGHYDVLLSELEKEMYRASKQQEFERAAKLRDTIKAVKKMGQTQTVTSFPGKDIDLMAIARDKKLACGVIFVIREGKVVDRNHYFLNVNPHNQLEDILTSFVKQYYARASFVPSQIVVPGRIQEKEEIMMWLSEKKGDKVRMVCPQTGDKKRLLGLAEQNANLLLAQKKGSDKREALFELKDYFNLPGPPLRIEGMDISNTGGAEATGSVVVFEEGRPKKSEYRKFKIKAVQNVNDFAMLAEVIRRRYERVTNEGKQLPDLILVDGGKGQVGICFRALEKLGLSETPLVGLAKEFEQIFVPHRSSPVQIPLNSSGMKLLRHIRDEAHRFAHVYHSKRRQKGLTTSQLEDIPGVGSHTKKLLLSHFKSLRKIKQAKTEELTTVPGIGRKKAEVIKIWLQDT